MCARLSMSGDWFIDDKGRHVLLRGVNLGGSSKLPSKPDGATHHKTDFSDHREVSFVDRPFPLGEADEHFRRIKHWGFNALRLVTTWEAIEHAGPGVYDTEYLNYLEELLKIAESYKLYIMIDPHQDCWSRMSGGDGAPGWTFEEVGMDITLFDAAEAALLMQYRYDPENPDAYPPMCWSRNRIRFACATMFTLFFGGSSFAPSCKSHGVNIQEFLQTHYARAYQQIATRVKDFDYVLGFGTLNEPTEGWIQSKVDGSNMDFSRSLGYCFTPIDAMATASGIPREVSFREVKRFGVRETRKDVLNERGVSVWADGRECIWRREEVWDIDKEGQPVILRNNHFRVIDGEEVDFGRDFQSPFLALFAEEIRLEMPGAILFYEAPPQRIFRGQTMNLETPSNSVHKPHWYDFPTIGLNRFMGTVSYDYFRGRPTIGPWSIQKMFNRQMHTLKKVIQTDSPTVLGEFGLRFDLQDKKAFRSFRTDPHAWKMHIKALSMYYNAVDANLLHSFLWNYTSDNKNEWGDLWNLEDFSIFSRDQQTNPEEIDSGGRAIEGFCRPHIMSVAGLPVMMRFNQKKREFLFEYQPDREIDSPTVVYVPHIQYPTGYKVDLNTGEPARISEHQLLRISSEQEGVCRLRITPVKRR